MTRGSPAQTLALQLRRIPALRMCTRALPPRFRRTHRVWGLVGPSPPLFPRPPISAHLPLRRRLYPWSTPLAAQRARFQRLSARGLRLTPAIPSHSVCTACPRLFPSCLISVTLHPVRTAHHPAQANDIEACVVRNDNLKFSRLSADELEAQLTALAERDDEIAGRD